MGRGGEGVGSNWRGVALTHQATVYKNKTGGQGNGTVFLFFSLNTSSHSSKRTAETKKTHVSSLTSAPSAYLSHILAIFCMQLDRTFLAVIKPHPIILTTCSFICKALNMRHQIKVYFRDDVKQ